jgi:transmembrane sensor
MGTVYATGNHDVRSVALPDGTRMLMTRGTRIAVFYGENFRAAQLLQGEARFSIPPDVFRTYLLDIGDRHLSLKDGAINLRLTDGTIELTVLAGVVSISAVALPPLTEAPGLNPKTPASTLVKAGETITIYRGRQNVRTLPQLHVDPANSGQLG